MYIDKSPRGARVSGKKFPVEDKKKASPEGSRGRERVYGYCFTQPKDVVEVVFILVRMSQSSD